jgi:hypothetical protein
MARIVLYDACVLYFNLGDFPASVLSGFGVEAIHPDEFIARLWDENAASVLAAAKLHRASLKRPPKTSAGYLTTLGQCRLIQTAARLRPHGDEL